MKRAATFTGWRAALFSLIALLFAGIAATPARAHQSSDAYLRASTDAQGRVALQADVALRDLDVVLDLDANADGQLSWGEVRTREREIADYVAAHVRMNDGGCALKPQPGLALDRKADGVYAVLKFSSDCAAGDPARGPTIAYSLFRDSDPTHRGLLVVLDAQGQPSGALRSLVPGGGAQPLLATAGAARGSASDADGGSRNDTHNDTNNDTHSGSFFGDGLHHILIGADHVLFIVCLLLPLALARDAVAGGWRQRLWPLLGLVTAFTVGHSITLGLASLRILSVPPQIIEPLIAVTIALTALDNIRRFMGERRVVAAFSFGLIHGFGFAGPLIELNLQPLAMASALLQFNLGVEAGQLLVVAVAGALLWPLRERGFAPTLMRAGSAMAGLIALIWLAERVGGFKLLPV